MLYAFIKTEQNKTNILLERLEISKILSKFIIDSFVQRSSLENTNLIN